MNGLLCYCRAGFEPELAGELTERAAEAGFAGYARTERDSGYVVFACDDAETLSRALPWSTLIFARQKLRLIAELRDLDASVGAAKPEPARAEQHEAAKPEEPATGSLAKEDLRRAVKPASTPEPESIDQDEEN